MFENDYFKKKSKNAWAALNIDMANMAKAYDRMSWQYIIIIIIMKALRFCDEWCSLILHRMWPVF